MKCRLCKYPDTKVLESRESKEGNAIRRRRECPQCAYRFTTFEKAEEPLFMVFKKDNLKEPFNRDKLLRSMIVASSKRNVSIHSLENIIDSIETYLRNQEDHTITSQQIGEMVLIGLKAVDTIAYVRFASVYRAYGTSREFINELKKMDAGVH